MWNNFGLLIGPHVSVAVADTSHVAVRFGETGKTASPEFTVPTYPSYLNLLENS